ncbi:hypothetical protein SAMN05720606_13010 [Paenibacillus polysaccharolyticus]|uniref:Uncharacterized protein n=1 Tax=Paenibacillus polysaccharolyticus TaxID=582692 RepID=A0A1G5LLA8_9BACL|nr:hypothetical protein SAMN05720606_13010 [Paenibacillus polysaccharolyticus]
MIFKNNIRNDVFIKPYDIYFKKRPSETRTRYSSSYPEENTKSIRIVYPILL